MQLTAKREEFLQRDNAALDGSNDSMGAIAPDSFGFSQWFPLQGWRDSKLAPMTSK